MQTQCACGGGNITRVLFEDALNMLPFKLIKRCNFSDRLCGWVGCNIFERFQYGIDRYRLGQIVCSAQLDGIYRCGNTGVTGEQHNFMAGLAAFKRGNNCNPVDLPTIKSTTAYSMRALNIAAAELTSFATKTSKNLCLSALAIT